MRKHDLSSLCEDMQQVKVDLAIIKTNLTNHLEHHTELKQEMQWKVGLYTGIITFAVTTGINLLFFFLNK